MNERQGFEASLEKDPYDSVTRLIFADWLEEQGKDDEANEQRRRTSPEWIESDQWLHAFADKCGNHCSNYSEVWTSHYEETRGMGLHDPRQQEAAERARASEKWVPVTYDMVVEAGRDFVETGGHSWFTQGGEESARDLLLEEGAREEFWKHWSMVTGCSLTPATEEGGPFSCSC